MSVFLTYLFLSLSVLTVIFTLVPLSPKEYWWIRVFDFPRLQIIVVGIFSLAGYLIYGNLESWWQYLLAAGLAACIVYQGWRIYPYTVFAKKNGARQQITRRGAGPDQYCGYERAGNEP